MSFQKEPIMDFIGKGITFPINLVDGKPPIQTGFELIKASIRTILGWPASQRFFLAEFGSRLEDLLEEPNDNILLNTLKTFTIDAVDTWETRIDLIEARIVSVNDVRVEIYMKYRIRNSKSEDSLIFPFYRQITT